MSVWNIILSVIISGVLTLLVTQNIICVPVIMLITSVVCMVMSLLNRR